MHKLKCYASHFSITTSLFGNMKLFFSSRSLWALSVDLVVLFLKVLMAIARFPLTIMHSQISLHASCLSIRNYKHHMFATTEFNYVVH